MISTTACLPPTLKGLHHGTEVKENDALHFVITLLLWILHNVLMTCSTLQESPIAGEPHLDPTTTAIAEAGVNLRSMPAFFKRSASRSCAVLLCSWQQLSC